MQGTEMRKNRIFWLSKPTLKVFYLKPVLWKMYHLGLSGKFTLFSLFGLFDKLKVFYNFIPKQLDEVWREMRWIMDALQYARYKQPVCGLPVTKLIDPSDEQNLKKINSASSHIDCLPSPSPSPEMNRRKAVSGKQ